jgi:cytochrome c-type biogenesis protein CcmH
VSPLFIIFGIFAALALVAAGFAGLPLSRALAFSQPLRLGISAAVGFLVMLVGLGAYAFLGSPLLATRSISAPRDVPSLIAALAVRAREGKFDSTGWMLLGRGYLSLGDAVDAAAAFRQAAQVAPLQAKPALLSAYGEALTMAASGTVTSEAEQVFRAALAGNPKDFAARYYVGLADAERGRDAEALALWKGLLVESPSNAPWRAQLVDHIAALESRAGTAPDISAMVQRLESRLKREPNDPEGWQRLVRAYAVLGEMDKARAALETARTVFKGNAATLAMLQDEARAFKLN